jgi:putative transposase
MNHSYHILYVHVVLPTKYRYPYLDDVWSVRCHQLLREHLVETGTAVVEINGLEDHVHLLLRLKADVSLSNLIGGLKGRTSYLINKQRKHAVSFRWAKGYFVRSVAPHEVDVVRMYIRNQQFRREQRFLEWMERHFGPPSPTPG